MKVVGRIAVDMKPVSRILKEKGLTAGGDVQRFHTANVVRRIQKYMPYRTGALIKLMLMQSPVEQPQVVIDAPQARYLYYGKVMVGIAPKVVTDKDLTYDKTKNPQAGPFWDRRLKAAEGKAMQADLQRYVDRKAGKR